MKLSKFHSNRGFHNWFLYNISDKFLQKYSKFYKEILVNLSCVEIFLKHLIKSILLSFCTLGKVITLYFNKVNRNWKIESQGYFVLVRKK